MSKIKELLFWRFSLFAGLLALASVLALSYFYYRLQMNSPFVYEQIIANISEYRVIDSKIRFFNSPEQVNFESARDNLNMQKSLMASTGELYSSLNERGIRVPDSDDFNEIEKSINLRIGWLALCSKGESCNIDEWNYASIRAWEACETLRASFYNLLTEQEETWSKNLRIFYILSVMLLLSTLFFAAHKSD